MKAIGDAPVVTLGSNPTKIIWHESNKIVFSFSLEPTRVFGDPSGKGFYWTLNNPILTVNISTTSE